MHYKALKLYYILAYIDKAFTKHLHMYTHTHALHNNNEHSAAPQRAIPLYNSL